MRNRNLQSKIRIFWRRLIGKKREKERDLSQAGVAHREQSIRAPTVTAARRLHGGRGAARRSGCGRGGGVGCSGSDSSDVGGNGDGGSGGGGGCSDGSMVMVAVVHRSKYIGWR